jgi:predicted PurR-regulated permease PerM
MWSTGVGDPVLWGTVAFILNYVPILGPATAIFVFLFAGSLTITSIWQALLPAALYGAIHVIEVETVTPMLLARRFTPIRLSWFSRSCSGFGCGASPARSFRRRF